jgi:hypothetical protein
MVISKITRGSSNLSGPANKMIELQLWQIILELEGRKHRDGYLTDVGDTIMLYVTRTGTKIVVLADEQGEVLSSVVTFQ